MLVYNSEKKDIFLAMKIESFQFLLRELKLGSLN